LLDKDSVVIAYDYKRGEPRAHLDRKQAHPMLQGDCIDCNQCVAVCPTGIDIRNGTQLECVNCTSCIDACNTIMDKVKRPRGLIRYTSEASIQEGHRFRITKRVGAYSIVLLILLSLLIGLLAVRSDVEATILRTPGMLYQKQEKNKISNLYNIKLVNKTFNNMSVSITCSDPTAEVRWVGNGVHELAAQDIGEGEFFLLLGRSVIRQSKTVVRLQIKSGDQLLDVVETNFIGPVTNTK
jgi:cytochrome c oxidase accessory protein FixG